MTDENATTKKHLQSVYSDLVGPTRHPSLSGSRYFITLFDDFSGFSMVRFLKHNGDAATEVKTMMEEMEHLFHSSISQLTILNRKTINALSTDGGGE